jgi:hypothetical protein
MNAPSRSERRKEQLNKAVAELTADGLHTDAAFIRFCIKFTPHYISEEQYDDMRETFFAGAVFIFSTIVENAARARGVPTSEQLAYMSELSEELRDHVNEMLPTSGSA